MTQRLQLGVVSPAGDERRMTSAPADVAASVGPLRGARRAAIAPGSSGSGSSGARSTAAGGAGLRELLFDFSSAPASLVANRALLRRTDTKFLVPERLLGPLLSSLKGDYLLLGEGGPSAYQTLYLDTPDLQSFHDHRRGRRLRDKVRVRDYLEHAVSFLEVKSRRSELLTVKRRRERPRGAEELGEGERAFLAASCRMPTADLRPAARVDYHRATLVAARDTERVTVDVDLAVGRHDARERLAGIAIVEVKQPAFSVSTPAMRALRRLGLRWLSVSKYCTAVALTRDVPCHRFLPALRKIEGMRT